MIEAQMMVELLDAWRAGEHRKHLALKHRLEGHLDDSDPAE
jgi:hypothetical protein